MERFPSQKSSPNGVSKSDAMAQVMAVMQMELSKGAIDSEPADFRRICADFESDIILPEEAIRRAHGISDSRMDYH